MRPDVLALKSYYATPLGRHTALAIGSCLVPARRGDRLLILGYGSPYVEQLSDNAERVVAAMPARQGAIACKHGEARPGKSSNVACLTDVEDLPFPDAMFDKVVLIHCLEFSGRVGTTLKDVARVLAPGGSVQCVVPNRVGVWSRAESTPFGNGRPFSSGQLSDLLREAHLSAVAWRMALMVPPIQALAKWMPRMEAPGRALWGRFGGVYVVEAKKEVFAAKLKPKTGLAAHVPLRVPAFSPASACSAAGAKQVALATQQARRHLQRFAQKQSLPSHATA